MDALPVRPGEEGRRTLSRRDALRSGGVVLGAAALWSTPVVHFVGATPAAAATPPPSVDLCPGGQPSGLVFAYLPRAVDTYDFGPGYVPSGPGMENFPVFSPASQDLVGRAVRIEFWANNSGLSVGGPDRIFVTSDSTEAGSNVVKTLPPGGLPSGGTFVSGDLHPNGKAGPNNAFRITDEFGNVQFLTFHTSCSKDLETGFIFGSIQVVGGIA